MANNSIKLTLGYEGTDFTRNLTIGGVADSVVSGVKANIKALNASIVGGTDGGLSTFFRADDYDETEGIGTFSGITAATIVTTETTHINLDEEGE
jgi:hypothetical protein